MVNSFSELEAKLNIRAIPTSWNNPFPVEEIKESYKKSELKVSVNAFLKECQKKYPDAKVNTVNLFYLGLIAESFDLLLAFFITGNNSIDLFIQNNVNTKEWMNQFKGEVPRRQFFELIHSCKNIKEYNSLFPISIFYNLYSPKLPLYCNKVNVSTLSNEYILVQYVKDIGNTQYRIIKFENSSFIELDPVIEYNPSKFNSITLKVDGKTFIGDCLKYLCDGIEDKEDNVIEVTYNDVIYYLDPSDGVVWNQRDKEEYIIPKFNRGKSIKKIFNFTYRDSEVVLLDNGYIWIVPDNTFINLKSIRGFENLNISLLPLSSKDKGIMISTEAHSIECVPTNIFIRYITKILSE